MTHSTKTEEPSREKPYHHGDLWQALVQAGLAILHEEGLHALTLRSVARRAGVSHAAPYRHFTDKDALLAAIAEDGFRRLNVGLGDMLSHTEDGIPAMLREASRRYIHFVLENPDHARIMFSGLLDDYEKYPGLCEASEAAFALLVRVALLRPGTENLPPPEIFRQGLAMWSMVHGLASLLMEKGFPPHIQALIDVDALSDYCADVLMKGLPSNTE